MIRRAYSVASSSVSKQYIEFYISTVRSGALTPRLYNLQIGDQLWMGPKFVGMFTLEEVPSDSNVLLTATGTGLAPYVSMMRTLVVKGGLDRKYAVIHGANHSWDLAYQAELQTLETLSNNFSYIPVISAPDKEPIAWSGATGFVADVWKSGKMAELWGAHPTAQDTHVYLCGNPLMVESTMEILSSEGFKKHSRREKGEVHLEEFWKM